MHILDLPGKSSDDATGFLLVGLALIWVHWLADFVLQTDKQATQKSSSNYWLAKHVAVYTVCLMPFGILFALSNGALHFCIDWMTSRAARELLRQERRKAFFIVIGWDQAVHMTCLYVTMKWFS